MVFFPVLIHNDVFHLSALIFLPSRLYSVQPVRDDAALAGRNSTNIAFPFRFDLPSFRQNDLLT